MIIERREDESSERLLARFRLMMQRDGILREVKRRRHFISKSETQRVAHAKAVRRARRNAEKALRYRSNGGQRKSRDGNSGRSPS